MVLNPALQKADSEWNAAAAARSPFDANKSSGKVKYNATAPAASTARVNANIYRSTGIRALMLRE